MGLRDVNVAVSSRFEAAGDAKERACVLVAGSVFPWFFLIGLKNEVMRVWRGSLT